VPTDSLERIFFELSSLKRQMAAMIRPATVHEVKGDKMRMVVGQDKDGNDVLGPWLDTVNHRGGSRERKFYKKGQNLMLLCPNGDLEQATIAPFAPNKNFKSPDHANDTGQDEEVFQLDNLRVKKTKEGYSIWTQSPDDSQQQQPEGNDLKYKEGTPQKRTTQKPKADMLLQLSSEGITGRIGKDVRFSASKDGAKLKAGSNFSTVTKDKVVVKASSGDVYVHATGTPYVNKPWQIGDAPDDPVADDDKVLGQEEE
jgi:hypothetical protein